MPLTSILPITLAAALATMVAAWLVHLAAGKASVVDSFWGPGFVVVAWLAYALSAGQTARGLLVCLLTTLWGARLCYHVTRRNHGAPEDPRYQDMRDKRGPDFRWSSLYIVFGLQAVILWIVSLSLQVAQIPAPRPGFGWFDLLGTLVFFAGLTVEAVADAQLSAFKRDPDNHGKLMTRGLWRYTRHPNYFGESLIWWGFWLIACSVPYGFLTVVSPVLITFLLLKVSGVPMLETKMRERYPEQYEEYADRTSVFVPWHPRSGDK